MAKRPTDEEVKAKALSRWNNEGGAQPEKRPRRPRDPNQLGKLIVDLSVGDAEDHVPTPEEEGKSAAAVELGRKGGAARAKKMSPERRAEIARMAAQARYAKRP